MAQCQPASSLPHRRRDQPPMCQCLSRRVLLALPVSLSLTPNDRPIEPHMRLPNAPSDRLTVALTFDACPGGIRPTYCRRAGRGEDPGDDLRNRRLATREPKGAGVPAGASRSVRDREPRRMAHSADSRRRPNVRHSDRRQPRGDPARGSARCGIHRRCHRHHTRPGIGHRPATTARPRYLSSSNSGFGIAGYSLNADAGASLPAHSVAHRIAGAISGDVIVAHINQPTRPSGAGVAAGILGIAAPLCELPASRSARDDPAHVRLSQSWRDNRNSTCRRRGSPSGSRG